MVVIAKKTRKRNRKKSGKHNRRLLRERRRRLLDRIAHRPGPERDQPMITADNIHYELGERVAGLSAGGIGAMLLLAHRIGLIREIDLQLHLLKRHLPYHESDHVWNIAFNILAGGQRIEHIERRRNDEVFLNALGAQRIPDPTTEGDFCRRFTATDVETLMDIFNEVRLRVWAEQPASFFEQAILDVDGTLVGTDAECKQGIDIAYNGVWGYHPLIISLANTAEPLYIVNRSGNRPSHEQADIYLDKAIAVCRRAGFLRILLRGDTDFSQSKHLDRWDKAGDIHFLFGFDANPTLKALADQLPADAYYFLERPPRYQIQTTPRQRPERVQPEIVKQRRFETIHVLEEMVAEFDYTPVACTGSYRVIVLRKRLGIDKGSVRLREEIRYFFYITNDRETPADQLVFQAHDRCDQENLIAQLKSGVRALTAPLDNLVSNWAYMVMASLAWSLKAWASLLLPEEPGHAQEHRAEKRALLRMEFATFCATVMALPCQIVRTGRRWIYRLLSWTPWQGMFLRLVERLHGSWLY